MQITLTLDLTEDNLDKLKVLCAETKAVAKATKKTAKKQVKEVLATDTVEPVKEAIENDTGTWAAGADEQADSAPITLQEAEKAKEKITKTDVRAVALKISKNGKSDTLREIFSKFGATNLKGIAEEDYEALMRELVAVNV